MEDAALHGGRLDVWGSPGDGASFRLVIPKTAGIVDPVSPLPLVPDDAEPKLPAPTPAAGPDPAALPTWDHDGGES
jgi:two-component system sensor histidine kinase MtrB